MRLTPEEFLEYSILVFLRHALSIVLHREDNFVINFLGMDPYLPVFWRIFTRILNQIKDDLLNENSVDFDGKHRLELLDEDLVLIAENGAQLFDDVFDEGVDIGRFSLEFEL